MGKISELPAAAPLAGTEIVPVQQGGLTKKAPVSALIAASLLPNMAALTDASNSGIVHLDDVVQHIAAGMVLDFTTPYFRTQNASSPTVDGLSVLTVNQAATLWAQNADGGLVSFAPNTPRVTTRGLLAEATTTNRALHSEDLTQAVWSKTRVTIGSNVANNSAGAATADKIIPTSVNGTHQLLQGMGTANSGDSRAFQVKLKADGYSRVRARISAGVGFQADFNLATGETTNAVGFSGGPVPALARLVALGGGIYRLELAATFNGSFTGNTVNVSLFPLDDAGSDTFTGDGVKGIIAYEFQLESGLVCTSYVASGAANGVRAADAAAVTLPAGAGTDQVEVTWGTGVKTTILRSALASPNLLNLASDGTAPWLGSYITRIELVPTSSLKPRTIARLQRAVREYGFYPDLQSNLPANDVPVIAIGANNAGSTINSADVLSPTVPRTDPRITYVGGVPMVAGPTYPLDRFYNSRGAYFGVQADNVTPQRGTSYFAYEAKITASVVEIPVAGTGNGGVNFRVLVNGKFAGSATIVTDGASRYVKLTFPTSAERHIRVETAGLPCNGFNLVNPAALASVARDYPLITMLGDSWGAGTGSAVGDLENIVLGRRIGGNSANASVGSTGLLNPGVLNIANKPLVPFWHEERRRDLTLDGVINPHTGQPAVPDMGIIFMSLNDESATDPNWTPFGATIDEAAHNRAKFMIDDWRTKRPGKPLLIFGPPWPSGLPNNRPVNKIYQLRDGAQRAVHATPGNDVFFLDRLMPALREGVFSNATDQAALYTGGSDGLDGNHPTPRGHRWDGLHYSQLVIPVILNQLG